MKEINERIVIDLGIRTAGFWGGRWMICLPREICDTIANKNRRIKFKVYLTENQKIILEPV
jgi:hypothetical protein